MNSLRRQLTRRLVFTLALLVGAGLMAIHFGIRTALVDAFDASLRAQALAVNALTEWEEEEVRFDFSDDFLRGYGGEHPRNYFELWSAAGTPIRRSPSLGGTDLARQAVNLKENPKLWNLTLPNGQAGRAFEFAFVPQPTDEKNPSHPPAPVTLVAAADGGELDETLNGLLATVAGGGGLLLVALFFAVPRVLRRGLAPLDRYGVQVAAIDARSLAARLSNEGLPTELQPICARLNGLLSRLETSFERERRFSADLDHELRTPIAELRSQAECALQWPESREPTADLDTLAIARQMEALVTQMLALARGEHAQLAVNREIVALEPLVRETWRPFAVRAATQKLVVSLDLAPATAAADPALLRSILANLFDNAVDYTAPGSEVCITLESTAAGATFRIVNPADNLAPADVERLFDRFWRKESARSGGGQHTGLGLALARTFATAMGWTLRAELDASRRLTFTLANAGSRTTAGSLSNEWR